MRKQTVRVELSLMLETNSRAYRVLKKGPVGFRGQKYAFPYLLAQVQAVHCNGCACTVTGRRYGPCDCGGQGLYDEWVRKVRAEQIRSTRLLP
jgi:hypothetical protein